MKKQSYCISTLILLCLFSFFLMFISCDTNTSEDDEETTEHHIHQYVSSITVPTCTEKGYTTFTCQCGDSYFDSYVDATGHRYTEVIIAPTCTEKGYTMFTCHCGNSYIDNYVNALGHNWGLWETEISPTCTEIGKEIRYCDCGTPERQSIAPIDHNFCEWKTTKKPTYTHLGEQERVCICEERETRPLTVNDYEKFELEKLGTIIYPSIETAQDLDVFEFNGGKYRIVGKSEDTLRIYSFGDYDNFYEYPVEGHHNYIECYLNSNGTPLIFTGYNAMLSWAEVDLNVDGCVISQTKLSFDTAIVGNNATPCIDFDNMILYWYGYKTYYSDASKSNYLIITKWDISALDFTSPNINQVELLKAATTEYLGITQGRKYLDGHIYIGVSNITSPYESKFLKVDADTGLVESMIEFPYIKEIEGVCFEIENGDINWYISDWYDSYKINFYY